MSFEILKHYVFEIIIITIVLLIAISVVTGVNPFSVFYKLEEIFDPSKINIAGENYAQGVDRYLTIECEENAAYMLTLDSAKFYYKGQPVSASDSVNFIVILDYRTSFGSWLFVGREKGTDNPVITCGASGDLREFSCPQDKKIDFNVKGTGAFRQKEVFHFTIWRVASRTDTTISSAAETSTFRDLLNSYSSSYISSFDIVKDTKSACQATECSKQASRDECLSMQNCYWGPTYLAVQTCKACPSYNRCEDYDKDQCAQCSKNCRLEANNCRG